MSGRDFEHSRKKGEPVPARVAVGRLGIRHRAAVAALLSHTSILQSRTVPGNGPIVGIFGTTDEGVCYSTGESGTRAADHPHLGGCALCANNPAIAFRCDTGGGPAHLTYRPNWLTG